MKIHRKLIGAATTSRSTTYYALTEADLKSAFENEKDANVWLNAVIQDAGFDAINFATNLFGSQVVDGTLYICVTDGADIQIDGNMVDPEQALIDYPVSSLSDYISHATDKTITKYITEYEVNTPDFDKLAERLLKDGISFKRLAEDYEDFPI